MTDEDYPEFIDLNTGQPINMHAPTKTLTDDPFNSYSLEETKKISCGNVAEKIENKQGVRIFL